MVVPLALVMIVAMFCIAATAWGSLLFSYRVTQRIVESHRELAITVATLKAQQQNLSFHAPMPEMTAGPAKDIDQAISTLEVLG